MKTVLTVVANKEVRITSVELVDEINKFRQEESEVIGKKYVELRHDSFMIKIKNELEVLASLRLNSLQNILESNYTNSRGKVYACYILNRDGVLQMLNSESVLVRYKTIEHINELEKQLDTIERIADMKGYITSEEVKQVKYASKYCTDDIHDRKSVRAYIRQSDLMQLEETVQNIIDVVVPMKGAVKNEIIDCAIKELKKMDAERMMDSPKNNFIKTVAKDSVIVLQDVKIGKKVRRINTLQSKVSA